MVMQDDNGMLDAAVREKSDPVFMKSKHEIWDYFLDKNNQDKKRAASEAARFTSGESSGKAYRNARRNFEGERVSQSGDTSKWKELGTKLPETGRTARNGEITITITGVQAASKREGPRDRTFTHTFKGSEAFAFVNNPSYREFLRALGYPERVIDILEYDYPIGVTSVG